MTGCVGSELPAQADRSVFTNRTIVRNMEPEPNRTLSDRAISLVRGERQKAYGPPAENLRRIGVAWAAIFDCSPIPAHKVALAMAALKLTRAAHRPDDDSLVDAVGYLELAHGLRETAD